jgi:hypothetical protein
MSLAIGLGYASASALLLEVSRRGRVPNEDSRRAVGHVFWAGLVTAVGYGIIAQGIAANPNSNIPGPYGLLAAPFYWASSIALIPLTAAGWARLLRKKSSTK